jgi:hypothetical protein
MRERENHTGSFAEGQAEDHHAEEAARIGSVAEGVAGTHRHDEDEHMGSFAEGQAPDHHEQERTGTFADRD